MSDVSLLGSYGGAGGSSLSFRNILINGEVSRVNQRGFDGNWSAKSVGEYGYDRWKKADASNISQVVEEGNFVPDAEYVLSGNGVTTEVLTAPSSGNWTITVPNTASYVQLERGSVPSPFEQRPIGMELSLCQRYYLKMTGAHEWSGSTAVSGATIYYPVYMCRVPDASFIGSTYILTESYASVSYPNLELAPSFYKCSVRKTAVTSGTYVGFNGTIELDAEL